MKNCYFKSIFAGFIFMNLLFVMFSCGTSGSKSESSVTIDEFTTIPDQVVGCSCIYSIDEKAFDENKFIYANDFDKLSFISINGVMTQFTRSEDAKDVGEKTIVKFKNENYELVVTVTKKISSPEGEEPHVTNSGTLELIDKDGKSTIKNFYGICGC